MAKPFKCDREELKRKMELWKAQEEEKRRAPEAVVKKHLETLASGNLDFEARKEAILLLGASKDKRAEPVLIAELDRLDRDPAPNPVLRCLAVRALGMLRTPKAATRIAAILRASPVGNVEDDDESEEEYRREAVFTLRLIGGETARNAFETVVKAPREYRSVRETAGNALRNMK
jgi:HEAT repeat protein